MLTWHYAHTWTSGRSHIGLAVGVNDLAKIVACTRSDDARLLSSPALPVYECCSTDRANWHPAPQLCPPGSTVQPLTCYTGYRQNQKHLEPPAVLIYYLPGQVTPKKGNRARGRTKASAKLNATPRSLCKQACQPTQEQRETR